MVRLIALVALAAPVLGARIQDSETTAVARGLEVLTLLKENPDDVKLQNEYRDLLGEVEFAESRIFLETGAKTNQAPVLLGQMSETGAGLVMAERTGTLESLGRFLTQRRDYVFEQEGGDSKYVLDGKFLSMHSRMHVFKAGEANPRFILRRAFNYLNPVSSLFGQFVYRVIQCTDAQDDECSEGEYLYTITKDRLGRGVLWGMDEYRVYTGTGGCSRSGYGVLSCNQDDQVLYSLGSGLSEQTFSTEFYKGNILAIHANGEATVSQNGAQVRVGIEEVEGMRIAHATQVAGPPRVLNWAPLLVPVVGPVVAQIIQLARALVWTDSYNLKFEGGGGAVDDLLLSLMVAAQDLTRDVIASRNVPVITNAGASAAKTAGQASQGLATGAALAPR